MTEQPPSLDYRDPSDDVPSHRRKVVQYIFGFVCGVTAIFISGCAVIMSNIYYSPNPISRFETNEFAWRFPTIVTLAAVLALTILILFAKSRRKMPFVAGAITGAVVMTLIDGVCFISNWR
jgi:hypothetical protein